MIVFQHEETTADDKRRKSQMEELSRGSGAGKGDGADGAQMWGRAVPRRGRSRPILIAAAAGHRATLALSSVGDRIGQFRGCWSDWPGVPAVSAVALRISRAPPFDAMMQSLVMLNIAVLCIPYEGMSSELSNGLDLTNNIFSFLFVSEMLIQMVRRATSFSVHLENPPFHLPFPWFLFPSRLKDSPAKAVQPLCRLTAPPARDSCLWYSHAAIHPACPSVTVRQAGEGIWGYFSDNSRKLDALINFMAMADFAISIEGGGNVSLSAVRCLRMLRVLRIFKLVRHFHNLRVFMVSSEARGSHSSPRLFRCLLICSFRLRPFSHSPSTSAPAATARAEFSFVGVPRVHYLLAGQLLRSYGACGVRDRSLRHASLRVRT